MTLVRVPVVLLLLWAVGMADAAGGSVEQTAAPAAERAPVSLGILIEAGGRSERLDKVLTAETAFLVRPLVKSLQPADKAALWTYADTAETLIDFAAPRSEWNGLALSAVRSPARSGVNFYDAAIMALDRLSATPGRRVLVIITTGVDSSSRATLEQVIARAQALDVSVFAVGLGRLVREYPDLATEGPLAGVNWRDRELALESLARQTGGRAFVRESSVDIASALPKAFMPSSPSPSTSRARPRCLSCRTT